MFVFLSFVLIVLISVFVFLNTERFGKHPSGERLKKIKQSPNYKNRGFKNLNDTPMFSEGVGYREVLYEFLFLSKPKEPTEGLPFVKTDLYKLDSNENVLVWMGHSSYFMQLDGKKILVDPVLSGNASPISFTTKAYPGTDVYKTDDIPEIDYLFLTHDHWDHMDYKTLKKLKPKIKNIITGLGNGAHLEYWGFNSNKIFERDWYESLKFEDEFEVHVTPARHFSGRGFKRAQTLWASFVLKTPSSTILEVIVVMMIILKR